MEYYKVYLDSYECEGYFVYNDDYDKVRSVNEYLVDNIYKWRSLNSKYIKARILCEWCNYLSNRKLSFYDLTIEHIADYLIHLRCPEGIRLDKINVSMKSEEDVMKNLSTIIDFLDYIEGTDYGEYENIFDINSLFCNKGLSGIKEELDSMNIQILNKINKLEYINCLDSEQYDAILDACETEYEVLVIWLIGCCGIHSKNLSLIDMERLLEENEDEYQLYYGFCNYGLTMDLDRYLQIKKHLHELRKLDVKKINKIIKALSQRTGLCFTESALIKHFITFWYEKNQGLVFAGEVLQEYNYEYILSVVRKELKIDRLNLYKNFYEQLQKEYPKETAKYKYDITRHIDATGYSPKELKMIHEKGFKEYVETFIRI